MFYMGLCLAENRQKMAGIAKNLQNPLDKRQELCYNEAKAGGCGSGTDGVARRWSPDRNSTDKEVFAHMKATGILKSVDELGRIVLPKKMRESLEIDIRDKVEIFVEGDRIILKKYVPSCIFCGSDQDVVLFCEKRLCRNCLDSLKQIP